MKLFRFVPLLALSLLMTLYAPPSRAASPQALKSATDGWNTLLQKHVRPNGGVDYQGFAKDLPALTAFIKAHATLDLKGADDNTKKATYINLYNATMIYNLLKYAQAEHIDVASAKFPAIEINDIKVPGGNIWNGDYKVELAGQSVSLDEIEHGLIRGQATGALAPLKVQVLDPRIHAAVNCAAMSCPRLREIAYRPETVDHMLDENIRAFVSNEAQFHKVDDGTLKANSIVYWYYDDFDTVGKKTGHGAGDYLAQFVSPQSKDHAWKVRHLQTNFNDRSKIALKLSSAFDFTYDWRVNDVRNRK